MTRPLDTNEDAIDREGGKGGNPCDLEYVKALRTVDSVTIPREVFEMAYGLDRTPAQPRAVLRSMFGNPFPMCVEYIPHASLA